MNTTTPPRLKPASLLPLAFIGAGLAALLAACGIIITRPEVLTTYHYNQHVIATTHLVVLGWLLSVVMGAMYQLVPVALETRLHNERMARWQFWFHLAGFSGMVLFFWRWDMKQVGHFGSIFGTGVALFVYNIARTVRKAPKRTPVSLGVSSTLFWLSLTMIAGLYLAASKCWSFSPFDSIAAMHAHAHLGIVGIFLVLVVGVAYRLAPMFTISEIQNQKRASASIWLLNAGLATALLAILGVPWLKPIAGLALVAGIGLFAMELAAILRARRRAALDFSLKSFLGGIAFLAPTAVLGAVLSWPTLPLTGLTAQLENLYGFLAIFGFLTFVVVAMLHKIVPFLVWHRAYASQLGKRKVPSLEQMFSHTAQKISFWTAWTGILGAGAAIMLQNNLLLQICFSLALAGFGATTVNLLRVLQHLRVSKQPAAAAQPYKLKATSHA